MSEYGVDDPERIEAPGSEGLLTRIDAPGLGNEGAKFPGLIELLRTVEALTSDDIMAQVAFGAGKVDQPQPSDGIQLQPWMGQSQSQFGWTSLGLRAEELDALPLE